MMPRQTFLASALGLISVIACAWSFYVLKAPHNHYLRSDELRQVIQSLQQVSLKLDPVTTEQHRLDQAVKNLDTLSDGSLLVEERALHIAFFLVLLTTGFATLNGLASLVPPMVKSARAPAARGVETSESFQMALDQTLAELAAIKAQLNREQGDSDADIRSPSNLEAAAGDIVALESQLVFIKSQTQGLAEQNSKSLENLQRLTSQADDFTGFAAASRLEWNGLAVKLSQFKESQDHVRGNAEMLEKMQQGCQDMLNKSLEFAMNHSHHSERAKVDVSRMYVESKSTTELFSKLIQAMSESNGDVDLANKLVRGLSERAEEIVNIIDVIDDIAEQTNQLALNASIEAARAGEQGKGFAVVAAEVRHLAARSSTATRSITELLETIQAEADKASSCLEKTNTTVGTAHSRIVEVDHRSREAMTLSRQVGSEITDLIRVTAEHTQELDTITKQSLEVSRMVSKLIRRLDEVDQINASVHQESSQLAIHTDRISRMMSRQYFAIQYSERMTSGQSEGLASLVDHSAQVLNRTQNLRVGWEESYQRSLGVIPRARRVQGQEARELSHRLDFCQTNLTVLQNRGDVRIKSAATDGLSVEPQDDDDIQINNSLQKAS